MKSYIWRFVTDESGDIDGLTIFSLTVGFIAAIALLNGTVVARGGCEIVERPSRVFTRSRARLL